MSCGSVVALEAPAFECDLVMKGGVTSGIIYPAAIASIGELYRLRSIGGTSAGAIGAAAAAAMEFGRRSGRNPYARVQMGSLAEKLGRQIDGKPLLRRLFEPDRSTAGLFRLFLRLADANAQHGKTGIASIFLFKPFLGALLLLAFGTAALVWFGPWPPTPATVVAPALVFLLGVPLGTLVVAYRHWAPLLRGGLDAAAENGFGFCSGLARYKARDGTEAPSLSEWLHGEFQTLAGLPEDEPLTFGDLWAAADRTAARSRSQAFAAAIESASRDQKADPDNPGADPVPICRIDTIDRDIQLALVASDINRAQSVQLPFMRREDRIYARISDLAALLPASVVNWLIANARTDGRTDLADVDLGEVDPDDLIRLPWPEDMPVLLAVRISLSFPFLFRAVRLYLVRRRAETNERQEELAEIWLTDGGITSNFPIHLFDAPIPVRPTFCINLLYHDDELEPDASGSRPVEGVGDGNAAEASEVAGLGPASGPFEKLVYMLNSNRGRLSAYTRLTQGSGLARLGRFAARIVTTARQWGDNQLIDVPGYRDRIVHIRMKPDEGGFNLEMNSGQIKDLQKRGAFAGHVIASRFLPDAQYDPLREGQKLVLNWANHRFVRFRSFLAGLELAATRFTEAWTADGEKADRLSSHPSQILASIEQMVDEARRGGSDTLPQKTGYPFELQAQRDLAHEMVKSLIMIDGLSAEPATNGADFVRGRGTSPRPKSRLQLRPAAESDPLGERP